MYPLLLCSVLVVAITLERASVMARARVDTDNLAEHLREALARGDTEAARRLCESAPMPLRPVALAGLQHMGRSREEVEAAMQHAGILALDDLESNLPVLGTIGGTAPFIGLFGTVLGIMRSFHNIQSHGHAGTAVVAGGVSEALIATAAGLVVAVFAVVSYNVFLNRIRRLEVRLEGARSELLFLFTEESDWQHAKPIGDAGRG